MYSSVKGIKEDRLHMSTSMVILADGQSVTICDAPLTAFDNVYRHTVLCVSNAPSIIASMRNVDTSVPCSALLLLNSVTLWDELQVSDTLDH